MRELSSTAVGRDGRSKLAASANVPQLLVCLVFKCEGGADARGGGS